MNLAKYKAINDTYILTTDEILAGAEKMMLDLFNATNGEQNQKIITLLGLYIAPKTDVAVTGAVSPRFNLYRTSAAGTGGTGFAYGSTNPDALNITPLDSASPSLAGGRISARTAPTSGATKRSFIDSYFVHPEETNAGAVTTQYFQLLPNSDAIPPIAIRPAEGLLIQQDSVASLNNYVFKLIFGVGDV